MKLGAHVSIAGGYTKAVRKIHNIGGNCLQMFASSPRGWNFVKLDEVQNIEFKELKTKLLISSVFFHASYLINLADEGKIGHLSKLSLIKELETASKLDIIGSIIHLGSFKGNKTNEKYQTLINHIKEILDKTPTDSLFIIENAGNKKIGQSIEEIAMIVGDVDNDRVKVCLDTCHLFSAGYDIQSDKKLDVFLHDFDQQIGLNNIAVWHLNDSKDPYKSFRDRHENIGTGTIGLDTFRLLLNHEKLKKIPFIIETPGFDGNGPDKRNLDILKGLI
ncbi:hypothetical protein A2334_04850 [Candidatus Roizmanbacteria bacterium RIFOXYB2_FULL_38_10]|uniref:Probable endonuclease 4 n=1 Tax=Candidatus Roizmanbacteria bacterium RIFOXYD1_FULL_38_12 TaxID=1802093 RepID=A0A1F7L2E0_9BACT|nr:MAG: hypothetical protein A3K47_00950 [Candidatus Roizmanbacteria bacterium RIFOXYA2_FULL_38_14]OGK64329.1 MAG: hypothetical protein A3K27_00950 [Candidatus Roizmanbacteria bacterium RIFOXYA1_FULL_37_12]OGK66175.1 MAG: hypothetical protein A3K38_00950 [Candidatus Roizmanbacteria bacterium RIFOXYB1_FULL_40_23]OGK68840.1 MAG: hypothetical protein A2334_04850 [Candidatus Roizmanbacteria bacterium RIFOXYB2_FULL_38_10]OGK70580.1 MAG: hypothetical protein A3K21_00955 [Candidatus Roizmanbacteria ba